ASGNSGKLGIFFSGTRQATDLRREPVVGTADTNAEGSITTVHAIQNYSNHGEDLFGFAKLNYSATDHDVLNLDANWSRSRFQTPFDSAFGVINDRQTDINGFVNVGYTHRVPAGSHAGSETFISGFYRHGSLNYVPGVNDSPSFTFAPDTTLYNIAEQRSFNLYGIKADYALRMSEQLGFKFGVLASLVRGQENFQSFDSTGAAGPASNSPLNGTDVGVYAQTQIAPSEQWEIRAGVRFDNHNYPLSATTSTNASQVSPRLRISFFPSPATTLWAYYGRQFVPTNTEDLRNITAASAGGTVTTPTLPERDDFFEIGMTHRFPAGIVAKLSAYHKRSAPGIDDTQIPGTAITTDVNIDHVRITGLEGVVEIRPRGPVSGFVNVALNHAYGYGAVTGGFFTTTPPAQPFDLDHDQRFSATAGLTVGKKGLLATLTGIYGSGLTNGVTPNAPGIGGYDSTIASTGVLGTGLFDFNKEFKVKPSFILNGSASYSFAAGRAILRPQLYVDNIFNLKYSLKGAFFSGAVFGRPRTFQLRMNIDM
ncbi:MAG TPA: TonB-dependent receptor, partial [Gemmatimonadales bacterium]